MLARGALRWAVKESFVRYVTVVARGTSEALDGAILHDDGDFEFPLQSAESIDGRWQVLCSGSARFAAHHGFLDVNLSMLMLDLASSGDGEGFLAIAGPDGTLLRIATFSGAAPAQEGSELCWSGVVPVLTEVGSEVFGNVYAPGSELAPMMLTVPID